MIPVFGEDGLDCFPACVASILEMPLAEMPYARPPLDGDDRVAEANCLVFQGFLVMADLGLVFWRLKDDGVILRAELPKWLGSFLGFERDRSWIGCFKQPDDVIGHAVVMSGPEVIHDPDPSGAYLAGDPPLFCGAQILPLDKARKIWAGTWPA